MPPSTAHYLATATTRTTIAVNPGPALLNLALVHGYSTAFWWGAGIFVVGAVACGTLLHWTPRGTGVTAAMVGEPVQAMMLCGL
jgi:threonine/homoserine/homoserine lactone efflux protein